MLFNMEKHRPVGPIEPTRWVTHGKGDLAMQHHSHCGAAKVYGSPSATLRWSAPISPNKGLGTARTFASTTIAHPQYLVYPQNNKIKTTLQIDYQDKISSFCHKTDNFIA
jgi:hypothetical protein